MQKLIQHSDFSCTFDPVAATVLLNESLYTFKEMKLKVETEPPVEARLRTAQEGDSEGTSNNYTKYHSNTAAGVGTLNVGVALNNAAYFEFLKNIIQL
jgi:hypothetical protein